MVTRTSPQLEALQLPIHDHVPCELSIYLLLALVQFISYLLVMPVCRTCDAIVTVPAPGR